jgi:hypothetical protein
VADDDVAVLVQPADTRAHVEFPVDPGFVEHC